MEGWVVYPMEGRGSFIIFEEQRLGEGKIELVGMNCLFIKIYLLGRKRRLSLYLVLLL